MSEFPYERAAIILAESELYGDLSTSNRWGITDRTIRNYRARAVSDSKLSCLFQIKRQLLEREWINDATRTLKTGLNRLNQLIPVATASDAATIHAIAGAIKIVGELKIASDALSEPTSYQSSERAQTY